MRPKLRRPENVLLELSKELDVAGRFREVTYLSSREPQHRWAAESFSSLGVEFEQKAVWVAKKIREKWGPPGHVAYRAILAEGLAGLRAAAWEREGLVLFVSLRTSLGSGKAPSWFRVVLGALKPRPPSAPGPEKEEGHEGIYLLQ
jgi:hypothetical protein